MLEDPASGPTQRLDFLAGGGEMGARMRAHDWAATPLGPPEHWPQSLRSALSICLHSSFPTAIYWGEDLRVLYNDAWAPIPGERHPGALGRPGHEVWHDIWPVVGPQLAQVVGKAEGFSTFDQMLPMLRNGQVAETYWNYSFTPIRGEGGAVVGIFNQGHETTDRVLRERHREAEVARQRRMFQQAPGFITALRGPDHVFEFVNDAYRRLFGGRDFIGHTVREVFPELVGQGYFEWLDEVYATGKRFVAERVPIDLTYPGLPPERRYLDFIYEPVLDEQGAVTGIFCEGFDATPARVAEQKLRASEERFRTALEIETVGAIFFDADGRLTDTNDAFLRMGGHSRPELERGELSWRSLTPPEWLPDSERAFQELKTRGQTVPYEKEYVRPDGTRWWGLFAAKLLPDGTGFEFVLDITDRKQVEQALRETEERFRLAARATADAVWDWDLQADTIHWNEAVQVLFGYAEQDIGPSAAWWQSRIHPDDRDRVLRGIDSLIDGGERWHDEYRFLRADGSYATVLDRGYVVRDDAGRSARMVGAMQDVTERRRAEQALRASEERLRVAQAAGGIGTFELLPETRRIVVSDAFCRLWGVTPVAEVPVRDFLKLIHTDDRERVTTGRSNLAKGALDYIEYRIVRPDTGETRWMARRGEPVVDATGRMRYFGISFDITERKAAEEALRESEARLRVSETRFRQIAELAPAITWFGRPDGSLSYLNTRWYDYTGQTPEEALPSGWVAVIHPDDLARLIATWDEARVTGGAYSTEARLRRHDGAYHWFLIRALPLLDEAGQVTGWLGTDIDIDDQKVAELKLAQLNETLEQRVAQRTADRDRIWRLSTDVMLVADFQARVVAVNPAWTTLFGWQEDELVGRDFVDLIHPDDVATTLAEVGKLADGVTTWRFENRYRHKDGSYRWLSWTAVPDEGFIHAVGRDVHAEKEAAEALQRTEAALRQSQKMEAVGQLTGGLAHDFNNLLTGISGSLELLQTRMSQGRLTDLDRYINAAQGAARRAAALTHRLLAFSRRQTLDPKPTDVNALVNGLEELIRRTVGPSIQLEVVGAAGLWTALVDPNQLENAILNLCINARDAMPEGGRITIETGNKWLDDHAARERDLPHGQYLSLCVTDTGTGMTPDVVARAFDPFFTTKPIGEGTGLGLSMIYGFARQSGGTVRIYTEVGEGTTMCIYLPRHYGPAEGGEAMPDLGAAPRAAIGETVLIVDDEPTVRMLVTEVLEDLGYTAIEAADGPAGLKVLQSEARIDLLITDVGLPGGMNGRQMADAARVTRPGLRVLFITGYAENAALGNGLLEPGMEVMTKPFVMEALALRIKELIVGR